MTVDPNDEILAIKRKLADRFNNDIHLIAEDARTQQKRSNRRILNLPPRLILSDATANKPNNDVAKPVAIQSGGRGTPSSES